MVCSKCKKRMAVVFITRLEGDKSVNEGLCLVCAKELGIGPVQEVIDKMGLSDEEINAMGEEMLSIADSIEYASKSPNEDDDDDFEVGGAATMPPMLKDLMHLFQKDSPKNSSSNNDKPVPKENPPHKSREKSKKERIPKKKYKTLATYCEHLTQKARDGKLDRIIGRDKEIERVVQILNRRSKNNPCLIGEPGVGKTAIAEGIAIRIASGNVPKRLADKEIFLLDLTALVAGTQFRGQFESRVKSLIDEVKSEGNVILFIDEVHNLVGVGDSEGSMNAANILKPPLSRGEIQVIGATTFNEYRKYIEKDSALERRFQPVTVEEPSISDTIDVLNGIKDYYEAHHRIKVPKAIVSLAVNLSERFITDRFLPDKAIDLLDESCSCATLKSKELTQFDTLSTQKQATQNQIDELMEEEEVDYEKVAVLRGEILTIESQINDLKPALDALKVTSEDLATVIELWTGIPATKINQSDFNRVANIEFALKEKIIGQDEAVELVAASIRRSRVKINPRLRPASFIFVGPTGVGKTELVKVLANELFDNTDPLIRLDMSEFMDKYSVSRIVGSPPGYVGYDEAGQLTEKVRRKPYSVVLFDEIEKAHPDVLNILLQILDEGKVTDSHGRTVNFQNTVIVMTSNAGSNDKQAIVGFNKPKAMIEKEKANKALADFLRPEFLSRVDETIVFRPLEIADFEKIAALMLNEFVPTLDQKGITFGFDDAALKSIANEAFDGKFGARDIRRVIRKKVEDEIAMILVNSTDDNPPAIIKLTVVDDCLKLITE